MVLVDNGVYVQGRRVARPVGLEETLTLSRSVNGMVWIGLYRPTEDELAAVAAEFGLHPLAVEDAHKGHQRAKLERYGSNLFVVLRSVSYSTAGDDLAFGEVHVFVGQGFVVTVRHAETPHLSQVRARLEARPEVLCKGPEAVVCAIFDEVVDGYGPVAARLQEQIDTIEDDVFDGVVDPNSSRRIYRLLSEVIGFQRAVEPVPGMLEALLKGADKYDTDEDTRNNLRMRRWSLKSRTLRCATWPQPACAKARRAAGSPRRRWSRASRSRRSPRGPRSCLPPRSSPPSTA